MAAATMSIPANFEVIMAVVAASFFVHHLFMAFAVGKARRQYGVKYPDLYATKDNCPKEEDAKVFNCVQRGHQNSLELQPIFLTLLVCAGLKVCHFDVWADGQQAKSPCRTNANPYYNFKCYSTGVPNNRLKGGIGSGLSLFALIGVIIKSVVVWGLALSA